MARAWEKLARAVRSTALDTSMDDLCQLVLTTTPKTLNPIPGVRYIYFTSKEDLHFQLGFLKSPIPLISSLDPTAKEFIPANFSTAAVPATVEESEESIQMIEADALSDLEVANRKAIANPPSEEESRMVTWCARRYRRRVQLRNSPRSGNHFYDTCVTRVNAQETSPFVNGYSKYYLGPLPHLLAWLERAAKRSVDTKKRQSQKLVQVSHEVYDQMIEKIDELS
jgi:hypothetical protein